MSTPTTAHRNYHNHRSTRSKPAVGSRWTVDPSDNDIGVHNIPKSWDHVAAEHPSCAACPLHDSTGTLCIGDLESCVNVPCGCSQDALAEFQSSPWGLELHSPHKQPHQHTTASHGRTFRVVRYHRDRESGAGPSGKGARKTTVRSGSTSSGRGHKSKRKGKPLRIDPHSIIPFPPMPPLTADTIPEVELPSSTPGGPPARGTSAMARTPTRYYTREEVAQHNTADDLWIIVGRNVLNLTNFHQHHPGGGQSIVKLAGHDATEHLKFHSSQGRKLFRKYHIGKVADYDKGCTIL